MANSTGTGFTLTGKQGTDVKIVQMLFVFFAVYLVYLWSAPRTVVFEDDGLLRVKADME